MPLKRPRSFSKLQLILLKTQARLGAVVSETIAALQLRLNGNFRSADKKGDFISTELLHCRSVLVSRINETLNKASQDISRVLKQFQIFGKRLSLIGLKAEEELSFLLAMAVQTFCDAIKKEVERLQPESFVDPARPRSYLTSIAASLSNLWSMSQDPIKVLAEFERAVRDAVCKHVDSLSNFLESALLATEREELNQAARMHLAVMKASVERAKTSTTQLVRSKLQAVSTTDDSSHGNEEFLLQAVRLCDLKLRHEVSKASSTASRELVEVLERKTGSKAVYLEDKGALFTRVRHHLHLGLVQFNATQEQRLTAVASKVRASVEEACKEVQGLFDQADPWGEMADAVKALKAVLAEADIHPDLCQTFPVLREQGSVSMLHTVCGPTQSGCT